MIFIFNYLETNHTNRDLLLHVPAWSYFFISGILTPEIEFIIETLTWSYLEF